MCFVYIGTCIYIYTCTYTGIYIHISITCVRTRVYTSVYQYGCIYIFEIIFFLGKIEFCFYENKCTYTRIYMYQYTCMHTDICVYIWVYIHFFFFFFLGKRFVINFFTIFLGVWHMDFVKLIPFWGFLKTWAKDKLFV